MESTRIKYIKPLKKLESLTTESIILRQVPVIGSKKPIFNFLAFILAVVTALIMAIVTPIAGVFAILGALLIIIKYIYDLYMHDKDKQEYLKNMQEYEKYISSIDAQRKEQNQIVANYKQKNYPPYNVIKTQVLNARDGKESNVWNIIPEHQEFLTFRIGLYTSTSPIIFQKPNNIDVAPSALSNKINVISDRNCIINNLPYVVNLRKNPFIAVLGDDNASQFVNAFMLNFLSYHAYDVVNIAVYRKEFKDNDYLRHLPHIWNSLGNFRFHCSEEDTQMLDYLEQIIKSRESQNSVDALPKYILIIEDSIIFHTHPISKHFTSTNSTLGFYIIFLLKPDETKPSICSMVINLKDKKVDNYREDDDKKVIGSDNFDPDDINSKDAENIARVLANLELIKDESTKNLPEMVTFYDLLDNDALRPETLAAVWESNRECHNLAVPIGVKAGNSKLIVNMKDGADGPHAIIAGMTGSGKSELLQTLILSLCVNYSPEHVNFAFIDFKEGSMALQFKGMPHESGILTNHSDNMLYFANRAITMLQQEKKYRSEILRDSKDINHYYTQRINNTSLPPLPHLFVIIDESAEVVDQFHDFMKEMVSLARVGRSMGIHLILSTQNPSRTVDKQIFDNSNLKICLQVLSEDESKAIIKKGDAAYIVPRGRAYIMTGNGQRYELFQSAYTGAQPTSNLLNIATDPESIEKTGNLVNVAVEHKITDNTQIQEVLTALKNSGHKNSHVVFSESLESSLYLHDANEETIAALGRYQFATVIGKADILEKQSIHDVIVDFDECRNLVIYGSLQSGKTTLVETILFDIAQRYNGNKIQFIVVPTSTSALVRFANATFVSECLTENNEKLSRLPRKLRQEIKTRKNIIQKTGHNNIAEYENATPITILPRIVVFIDSLQHYQNFEELETLFADGSAQVGIHFVVTYEERALPRNISKYFGSKVVLQMQNQMSLNYGISYDGTIENYSGRGVYSNSDNLSHEIQAFQPSLINNSTAITTNALIAQLNASYIESTTPLKIETTQDAMQKLPVYEKDGFPIGVFHDSLKPFSITTSKKAYLYSIVGDKQDRDYWKYFLNNRCSLIGNVVYFDESPDFHITQLEKFIDSKFKPAISVGKHLFVMIYVTTEDFFNNSSGQAKLLELLQSTDYAGRSTLIVITSAQLAKRNTPVMSYCVDQNSIIAIGGKHDSHVRFADVSNRPIGIPPGQAYVTTSSILFERIDLVDIHA